MEYTIIRKNRRTLGIKISQQGEVLVYAPRHVSINTIENILTKRKSWIVEAKNKIKRYTNGDDIIFLGKEYKVNIIKTFDKKVNIEFDDSKFNVYIKEENLTTINNNINEFLYKNYKESFFQMINNRIHDLSEQIGVKPNKVSIKNQKTIWGSCSGNDNISINFKLALAPLDIIDYIIVHELCHIIHKNHSKKFWNTVQAFIPDYNEKRKWLKTNGGRLLF